MLGDGAWAVNDQCSFLRHGDLALCCHRARLRWVPTTADSSAMKLLRLQTHQYDDLARLLHSSLDVWHRTRLNTDRFGSDWRPFRPMVEIYEALDPGCCVVAMDDGGPLLGAAFFHPRETHVGVGIVSVSPTAFGRGVARAMMQEIIRAAAGMPLRLVSNAMNLDSFSLYTRLGFVPQMLLQSMTMQVPEEGWPGMGTRVRPATAADVGAIADLEFRLNGIRKEKDYRFFVDNHADFWRLAVIEKSDGQLAGFLAASVLPAEIMLGQGVAEDEETMRELMFGLMDQSFRGKKVAFILPSKATLLVQQAYAWGGRNREINVLSVLGTAPPVTGVTLATFLPESG